MIRSTLPPQLHTSKDLTYPQSPNNNPKALEIMGRLGSFQPVNEVEGVDKMAIINKPRGCGLWTSTYLEPPLYSAWAIWCAREGFGEEITEGYVITPNSDITVYEVASLDDYLTLKKKYGRLHPHLHRTTIDFVAMAETFDAMHLTYKGEYETRHLDYTKMDVGDFDMGLYGWDCESTFWFKPSFQKIEWIGRIRQTDINKALSSNG